MTKSRAMLVMLAIVGLLSSTFATTASAGIESISRPDPMELGFESNGLDMALDADGNPVIVYNDPAEGMVIVRCDDPGCTGTGDTRATRRFGDFPEIAVSGANRPTVTSQSGRTLYAFECNEPDCLQLGGIFRVDYELGTRLNEATPVGFSDVVIDENDRSVVIWTDAIAGGGIEFRRCLETGNCSNDQDVRRRLHSGATPNSPPVLKLDPSGHPVVAYTTIGGGVHVLECNSLTCEPNLITISSYKTSADFTSMPAMDLLVHEDGSYEIVVVTIEGEWTGDRNVPTLSMFACTAGACLSALPRIGTLPTGNIEPVLPSLAMTQDGPVVAFTSLVGFRLAILSPVVDEHPFGTNDEWNLVVPDPTAIGVHYPSIHINDSGEAIVAGVATDGLFVIHCDDIGCVPTCNGLPVTVDIGAFETGTPGRDVIRGTIDADVIDGGAGGDVICGLGGDDVIDGGDGWDRIFAGAGNDVVNGGGGTDRLIGGPGNDALVGGFGNDRLIGGGGNDQLNGDADNDLISGGAGNDTIFGGDGDDELLGNLGRDTINGDAGNDIIKGGGWVDALDGGDGADDRCSTVPGEVRVNCERGVFGI